ncbi:MAG TPA: hypothetical protein VFS00_15855, partial [Polyangiaceae bacterium]|nr:hypothetical protein [Polyangiaceae bacterium]
PAMRARPSAAAFFCLAALAALAPPAPAAGREGARLGFELVAGKPPKLDGLLKDWPARPAPLGPGVRVALAYDDDALYAAFDVSDDRLARTPGAGPDDDHASLSLAFPEVGAPGRYAAVELSLFPGEPGNLAGVVKDARGAEVAGSRLVEAPRRGGYTFEAKLPWRSLAPAARVRCGLRALVRYHDGDGGRAKLAAASGPEGAPADWPRLETESERAFEGAFAREKKLRSPPQIDLVADVAGDALAERVLLWGRYLLVAGPRFRDGRQFYFNDLGEGAKPGALEVLDLTGDGKAEFVVRKRVERGDRWSELVQVLSFSGDAVATLFEHEVVAGAPAGEVSNEARFASEPGGGRVEIGQPKARGLTAASFGGLPDPATGVLVPWGPARARTFRWQDGKFVKISEDRGPAGSSGAAARAEPAAPPPGPSERGAPRPS